MSALTIPKRITVERAGSVATIHIDGEEFPHYLASEPIEVTIDLDTQVGTVRLTLIADHVDIIDHQPEHPSDS